MVNHKHARTSTKNPKNPGISPWLIGGIVVLAILVALIVILAITKASSNVSEIREEIDQDLIFIGTYGTDDAPEINSLVLADYATYATTFDSKVLSAKHFTDHNYAIITANWDSCKDQPKPIEHTINEDGELYVRFVYQDKCGVCEPVTDYYLVAIDKDTASINTVVEYQQEGNDATGCDQTDY